mmetsp:Transcript_27733/g.54437  ORF Transcript_27733/g.54437 Transcript_27733/m.54437 type:complete len:221 (+) Transcript_27733:58-720(+)
MTLAGDAKQQSTPVATLESPVTDINEDARGQLESIQAVQEIGNVPVKRRRRHEVWLNVYDIDAFTGRLNTSFLRDANLGAFHCGVQVLGEELFFAWGETDHTGIVWTEPRSHQVHVYRESISMGECPLSEPEIREVIANAMDAWPANSYHPLTRNCVTFAEELIERLQAPEPCPPWIRGAADAGNVPWLRPIADCGWNWVKWWCSTSPQAAQPLTMPSGT